ncbi:GntR family transcriptional regulator [Aciduricibacillus chroicocephali]|uniref:GntR family transcriptional regulator n=1 Tax=Aciduricibacillus chroicocephali TaxID=3054939 RepID=A0ABY9KVX0_9BACI|nr:GntR family transcriptional regulator [Bacillaceae bacterium 44XB]
MFIEINFEAEQPIYSQIVHQIIGGIARNDLSAGESLPSVRALAADIGVNLHTVNKAYQQLKQDGYIIIHRRKGVTVHPDGPPIADEAFIESLKAELMPKVAEAACRNLQQEELMEIVRDIYNSFRGTE